LITAARVRAQITQIDRYNTAVNAFKLKYNALPGDMRPDQATAYGLFVRTGGAGDGDGDGFVTCLACTNMSNWATFSTLGGENVFFWTDLSAAGLIDGGFNDNSDSLVTATTDTQYAAEMPRAKIGNGNFLYVNAYYEDNTNAQKTINGIQIIKPTSIGGVPGAGVIMTHAAGLTPLESFNIDQKIDDGLPVSGKVIAMYPDSTSNDFNPIAGAEIEYFLWPSICVLPGPPIVYNVGTAGVSTVANCSLRFNAPW